MYKSALVPLFGLMCTVFLPLSAEAAVLSVTPSATTLEQGSTVTMSVFVDSEGVAINNAEGTLVFPSELFDLVSINKDVSLFSLWIQAPSYDGNNGISFNGGLPSPGYQGSNGRLFTVTFRAKTSGAATFLLLNGAVRANDGLGTDVLRVVRNANVTVSESTDATPPTQQPVRPVSTPAETPQASSVLRVISGTHPAEDAWYSNARVELSWTLPSGADAVQTLLSKKEGATPTVLYRPATTEKIIDSLEDGVWYFNIRARVGGAWGAVQAYRLQIDTVVPQLQSLLTYDATSSILFMQASAQDQGSGIRSYEVFVDKTSYTKIAPEKFKNGFYNIPLHVTPGEHKVFMRVYDQASNHTDSDTIRVLVVSVPTIKDLIIAKITSFDYRSLVLPSSLLISLLSILMNLVLWRKLKQLKITSSRPLKRVTRKSRAQRLPQEIERP